MSKLEPVSTLLGKSLQNAEYSKMIVLILFDDGKQKTIEIKEQ